MALYNNVTRRYQHLPTGAPVVPAPVQNDRILQMVDKVRQLLPDRSLVVARRYQKNSNTAATQPSDRSGKTGGGRPGGWGVDPGVDAGYGTQLERAWQSRTRSDEIFPLVRPASSTAKFPWPEENEFGQAQSPTGRDYPAPRISPISARPINRPIPSPYVGTIRSRNDRQRSNFVPVSGGQNAGLDYGPAPDKIPYLRRLTGISLTAGPTQYSTQQFYDNISGAGSLPGSSIVISPPAWSNKTRGYRSASGILSRVQGGGSQRIPAVFVPQQVS